MKLAFQDLMTYDPSQKTAVSIRDGVLEYLGAELGMEPGDKIFRIYRSPATIANATMKMAGIPVTDGHVSVDEPAPTDSGMVESSEMIDAIDPLTHTTIATKNKVSLSDPLRVSVESGTRELSLGYTAKLAEHADYDFEQKDILPHHLAVVADGRCGSMCSFIDRKPTPTEENDMKLKPLHAAFLDEAGTMNLQQIAEVVASFPQAIQQMPLEEVQKIVPILMEAMGAAKTAGAEIPAEEGAAEETTDMDIESEGEEQEATDMEGEEGEEKDKPNFADSTEFKDAVQAATDAAVKRHSEVIEKAKTFVDESYSFADKSSDQIMRDAIATQSTEVFSDEELPTAFKLLKLTGNYQKFGDSGAEEFKTLADKEL